jgi:hypothetical protein
MSPRLEHASESFASTLFLTISILLCRAIIIRGVGAVSYGGSTSRVVVQFGLASTRVIPCLCDTVLTNLIDLFFDLAVFCSSSDALAFGFIREPLSGDGGHHNVVRF